MKKAQSFEAQVFNKVDTPEKILSLHPLSHNQETLKVRSVQAKPFQSKIIQAEKIQAKPVKAEFIQDRPKPFNTVPMKKVQVQIPLVTKPIRKTITTKPLIR